MVFASITFKESKGSLFLFGAILYFYSDNPTTDHGY